MLLRLAVLWRHMRERRELLHMEESQLRELRHVAKRQGKHSKSFDPPQRGRQYRSSTAPPGACNRMAEMAMDLQLGEGHRAPLAIVALCIFLSLVTLVVIAGERRSSERSQLTPIESASATL
jgi:hypothetical protein